MESDCIPTPINSPQGTYTAPRPLPPPDTLPAGKVLLSFRTTNLVEVWNLFRSGLDPLLATKMGTK